MDEIITDWHSDYNEIIELCTNEKKRDFAFVKIPFFFNVYFVFLEPPL